MTSENDLKLPVLQFALNRDHRIDGDICVCGAGRSKCGGVPSLWTRDFAQSVAARNSLMSVDDAFNIMRSDEEGLFSQIGELKRAGLIVRKGRLYSCIPEDRVDEVRSAVNSGALEPLLGPPDPEEAELEEEEVENERGQSARVPFRRAPVKQARSSRWSVGFSPSFWEGVRSAWEDTESGSREHQLALCLRGDQVVPGGILVGNPGSVESLDRDLVCPPDSVKIGSLHTHPTESQAELDSREGLRKEQVEETMLQSGADLGLMVKLNRPVACVKSARGVNCMINHSDYLNRELFRDVMTGSPPFTRDKRRMMGEMERRGIRKHRRVEGALTVSHPGTILCEPEGRKLSCSARGENESISVDGDPPERVSTRFTEIHSTGVEVVPRFDSEDMVTNFLVRPHADEQASCWGGYDGYIWCEGHDSMEKAELSKKLLAPLYERRIWDVLNGGEGQRPGPEGVMDLLEHYAEVLRTSPDEADRKKSRLLEGAMDDFDEDGDADKFTRRVLSSITIT